jgi:hypothetical protein
MSVVYESILLILEKHRRITVTAHISADKPGEEVNSQSQCDTNNPGFYFSNLIIREYL